MIDCFKGKYFFLSNFYPARVSYQGILYQNTEAAFHAQKDPSRAREFCNLNPSEAKRLGRRVKLRSDWELIKDNIMFDVVALKFKQNLFLAEKLLKTGDEELIEGNDWNDCYWGVCQGKGENKLGQILQRIRSELRKS
nr:MAG TPA: NADAR protein [Caudoviricetes sp.]